MEGRPCQRCGLAIEPKLGRPALMHPECRKLDRLESWRRRRAEQALEHAEAQAAERQAFVKRDYETRLARARQENNRLRRLPRSRIVRMLSRPDMNRDLVELLNRTVRALDEIQTDDPYQQRRIKKQRELACELMLALDWSDGRPR